MQDMYARATRYAISTQQLAEKKQALQSRVPRVKDVAIIEPFLIRTVGIKAEVLLAMYVIDIAGSSKTSEMVARMFTAEPDLPTVPTSDIQVKGKMSPAEFVDYLIKELSPKKDAHFGQADSLANVLSRAIQWDLLEAKPIAAVSLQRLASQLSIEMLEVHQTSVLKAESESQEADSTETDRKEAACKTAGACTSCTVSGHCSDNIFVLSAGWNDQTLAELQWGNLKQKMVSVRPLNW